MPLLRYVNAAAIAVCLLAAPALAAGELDVAKVCAERACRTGGFEAVVGVDAEHFTAVPVSHSPYLLEDGSILIFPGETIAVQFALDGDNLGAPISAKRYAPHLPALITTDGGAPRENPEDAGLPVVKADMPADEAALLTPNTVLLSYGQFKPKGDSGMVLTIVHNLPHTVKYAAMLFVIQEGGGYHQGPTSSCPVLPRMWGNEKWPDRLGPLLLGRFRFLPEGADMICN